MNENAPRPKKDSVGWFVREKRLELGLTQEQLAKQIGTSREYLSQIEGGRPKWPQRYISQLAEALSISEHALAIAAGKISPSIEPGESDDLIQHMSPSDKITIGALLLHSVLRYREEGDARMAALWQLKMPEEEMRRTLEWLTSSFNVKIQEEIGEDGHLLWTANLPVLDEAEERQVERIFANLRLPNRVLTNYEGENTD